MIIPKEIEKYLVKDEIIEKEFELGGRFSRYKAYASNKRLFISRGGSIRDIDYNHIASIELKQERHVGVAIMGLVLLGGGVAGVVRYEVTFGWALVAFGAIIFLLSLGKTQYIELAVTGVRDPVNLSGHGSELDSLFKVVREKRT
jgi:hypothetical protein